MSNINQPDVLDGNTEHNESSDTIEVLRRDPASGVINKLRMPVETLIARATPAVHATDPAAHGGVIGRAVLVALVGDSLTENCQPSATSIPSYWFHAMNQRLGLPFRLAWKSETEPTYAKSGCTTTQLIDLGYASGAAASAAEIVFELSGTNDLATSPPAEIAARRVQMWDLWLAKNKTVVALPITPRVNLNAEASEVNRLLAIASANRPRVVFCWEIFALLLDAAGAVLETTYSSGDGTHFNDLGCSVIATALATRLAQFGNRRARPAGLSMHANRFMTGDTGGLATGMSVSAAGTGTCTPSKVAMTEMGVSRFWQRFTFALTGQRVYTSAAITTIPGTKYRLSALMRVPAITAAGQAGISLRFWAGATPMGGVSADLNNYTAAAVRVETDEIVCPDGANVAVVWFVLNGTATVDFSDICVHAE